MYHWEPFRGDGWTAQSDQGGGPIRYRPLDAPGKRVFSKCRKCKAVQVLDFTAWTKRYIARNEAVSETFYGRPAETSGLLGLHEYLSMCCEGETRCACGGMLDPQELQGTYNAEIVCNARCMGATGPQCECSCGGVNHGGRHAH